MALVLGTNCGFVTVAPTVDPDGASSTNIDNNCDGIKVTSPATAGKITEIGWWVVASPSNVNFEVGLYDHDAVNDEPENRLYVDDTNPTGTTTGIWKRVTVDWEIDPETIYWIAVQCDDTDGTLTDQANLGARTRRVVLENANTLPNPWGASTYKTAGWVFAFYAVWEAGAGAEKTLGDTITMTDGLTMTLHKALSDIITVTDANTKNLNKILSETITISDDLTKDVSKILSDTLTITDALIKTYTKTFADTITVTDAKTFQFNKALSDTLSISDTYIKTVNKVVSDTVTLTDAINKLITKTFSDTITITDDFSSSVEVFPFPVYGRITDAGSGCDSADIYIQDTTGGSILTIEADVNGYYTLDIQDIVVDGHTYNVWAFSTDGKYKTDSFILDLDLPSQEMNLAAIIYALADTLTITDALSKTFNKLAADIITISDNLTKTGSYIRALSDTITITDTTSKSINKTFSETISITDALVLNLAKTLSDTITLSDALIKHSDMVLSDTVTITDGIIKDLSKTISDTIMLSDALIKQPHMMFSEMLTITDSQTKAFNKLLSDLIVITDGLSKILHAFIVPIALKGYSSNEETFHGSSSKEETFHGYRNNEQPLIIKKED